MIKNQEKPFHSHVGVHHPVELTSHHWQLYMMRGVPLPHADRFIGAADPLVSGPGLPVGVTLLLRPAELVS